MLSSDSRRRLLPRVRMQSSLSVSTRRSSGRLGLRFVPTALRSGFRRSDRLISERPISDQIADWNSSPGPKTLGGLVLVFEEKAFAIVFVLLLGVPALPLPTGGATHVFELIAMLLSLQLIAGR